MTYKSEIQRLLSETAYFGDYRYCEDMRGTLLDFECDILEPLIENEIFGGPEINIGGDWLGRYMSGRRKKDTGEYYFTTPGPARLKLLTENLERNGYMISSILEDHSGDITEARTIQHQKGYRFANQKLLAGTLRGAFIGFAEMDYGIAELVLVACLVPGEDLFRMRLFQTHYFSYGVKQEELKAHYDAFDFNSWFASDRFASIGSGEGRIFGGRSSRADNWIGEFDFISKGCRICALTMSPIDGSIDPIRLELCRKPMQVKRMLGAVKAIGRTKEQIIAA